MLQVITQPQKDSKAHMPMGQTAGKEGAGAALPESLGKQSVEDKQLKPFQFLMVNILREYLAMELSVQTPFPFDAERVYDDFGAPLFCRCLSEATSEAASEQYFDRLCEPHFNSYGAHLN